MPPTAVDDITAPEGYKVLSDRKGGAVIVDEDTKPSDLTLKSPAIPGQNKTKLVNNDENVLPGLEAKQKVKDDSEKPQEPKDRATSVGDEPGKVSPSNIGVEGKPTKKVLDDHPTADHEVTYAAAAPNSSHVSEPMDAATLAKRARVEGQADGQRQRTSTWWHPSARIEDGETEVKRNGGKIKVSTSEKDGIGPYNHW